LREKGPAYGKVRVSVEKKKKSSPRSSQEKGSRPDATQMREEGEKFQSDVWERKRTWQDQGKGGEFYIDGRKGGA